MAIEARLRELGVRHRSLDAAIEQESRRPAADDLRLVELKRRKLKLKEEIERLKVAMH
ncbi:MAG: YdcH family protein [Caulobacteraceae bacterium]